MRYLLLAIALIPAALNMPERREVNLGPVGYGRGLINPPTAAEHAQQKCLATMIYGEARGEKKTGQVAVAYSALNRLTSNKTLCDVVLAPKQYSIFNNNPELIAAAKSLHLPPKRKNVIDDKSWQEAMEVAELVVQRKVPDPTNGSTHYVAYKSLKQVPRWTLVYSKTAKIGNHTFFKKSVEQKPRLGNYPKRSDA